MPNRPRVVVPEILDGLPQDHPDAIASRRDLRRVNMVMGNPRWIARQVRANADIARRGITEIGAGDGFLAMRLAKSFPEASVTAIDLAPTPTGPLPSNMEWRQSDILDSKVAHSSGGLFIACLVLHHFQSSEITEIGRHFIAGFDALVIAEPDRRPLAHQLGRLAWPFINRVTRHDMHVSIDAGFAKHELPELLNLDWETWQIQESCTLTGARRLFCRKKPKPEK